MYFLVCEAFTGSGKPPSEMIMTDGCGFISHKALRKLQDIFQWPIEPTAIQMRIGGAKVSLNLNNLYIHILTIVNTRDFSSCIQMNVKMNHHIVYGSVTLKSRSDMVCSHLKTVIFQTQLMLPIAPWISCVHHG